MNALTIEARRRAIVAPLPVPASPLPRIRGLALAGSALVAVFVIGLGTWAALAPLESAAHATGVVKVESSRKTVQHLEGGIIGAILVHDGERVAAGEPLIRLDDTKARTALVALQGQLWDAKANEARLVAERDGAAAPAYPAELTEKAGDAAIAQVLAGQNKIFETRRTLLHSKNDLLRQRIAETDEEIKGLRAQVASDGTRIGLITEEIAGIRQLLDRGLERKPHLLQLQRELAEIDGHRGEALAQIARAQQAIAESQVAILNQQNDLQNEVAQSLRDTEKKIHELTEEIQAASDVLSRIEVRAPEEGIVTDLRVHTPGGVVKAGDTLLDLVPPEDRLIIDAQVRPEDISSVRAGLPAWVRLTPYKQRRTPPLEATVEYVSADSLVDKATNKPYYAARVRVDEAKLKDVVGVEMIPGMPAEVSIKTGESTVAMYALSPVLDSFRRAFREQ
jgi:HlyD family secretion protein